MHQVLQTALMKMFSQSINGHVLMSREGLLVAEKW